MLEIIVLNWKKKKYEIAPYKPLLSIIANDQNKKN